MTCICELESVRYDSPVLSGLADTRDQIADIIAKNGGTFDADLTRECTHLIVKISSPCSIIFLCLLPDLLF